MADTRNDVQARSDPRCDQLLVEGLHRLEGPVFFAYQEGGSDATLTCRRQLPFELVCSEMIHA
ncbi:MAG: hypothetical protein U0R50_14370 [Gaiellales bacterium]